MTVTVTLSLWLCSNQCSQSPVSRLPVALAALAGLQVLSKRRPWGLDLSQTQTGLESDSNSTWVRLKLDLSQTQVRLWLSLTQAETDSTASCHCGCSGCSGVPGLALRQQQCDTETTWLDLKSLLSDQSLLVLAAAVGESCMDLWLQLLNQITTARGDLKKAVSANQYMIDRQLLKSNFCRTMCQQKKQAEELTHGCFNGMVFTTPHSSS